jgi:hypothetical protein
MKFFEWMGATIAVTGLAMSVQVANAQQCNLQEQTSCAFDQVIINGTNYPPDYWPWDPYAGGGIIGGGGGGRRHSNTYDYRRVESVL